MGKMEQLTAVSMLSLGHCREKAAVGAARVCHVFLFIGLEEEFGRG